MSFVVCSAAALSVAMLFYYWRERRDKDSQRDKQLRERVTYMLWDMVNGRPEASID
jgi:membrane protein implicated in regulation of membrane protease activity